MKFCFSARSAAEADVDWSIASDDSRESVNELVDVDRAAPWELGASTAHRYSSAAVCAA